MNTLIPGNEKGKSIDLEESTDAETIYAAKQIYKNACDKLLHPDQWHGIAGSLSAKFQLKNLNNEIKNAPASESDYIVINIPAPGLPAGDGHDWVRIEKIENNFDANNDLKFIKKLKKDALKRRFISVRQGNLNGFINVIE